MTSSIADLQSTAAAYLPPEVWAKWSTLFRPALRISPAADPGDVVGQLGGDPALPADMEWPDWQGHGPLSFVASVDFARLPREHVDVPLPEAGTLLFFYFDGQADNGFTFVSWRAPGATDGAQVIYVPAGVPLVERQAPSGLTASPRVELGAGAVVSAPVGGHLILGATLLDDGMSLEEWDESYELDEAYGEAVRWPEMQMGGFSHPIQSAAELNAAHVALGEPTDWDSPEMFDEAAKWELLAQFTLTGNCGMEWRYAHQLFWLIRREDLAAGRFDQVFFTSQA